MSLVNQLKQYAIVLEKEPLAKHTTYKIGGAADYFILPNSQKDIFNILSILKEHDIPFLMLGKGSNVLISDEPFKGAVLVLDKAFSDFEFDENNILTAGAGCSLIALSHEAMKRSLSGLEFASGIPGSVGGGLYMNAGAYRSDLSDILIDVYVLRDGKASWIAKEDLEYTYRHSSFQKHKDWIILKARFQMEPSDQQEILDLMNSRKQRRMNTQPYDQPCAGSVFRNPKDGNAWKIIDELGYRGKSLGGAKVSEKHSNFIINADGKATARDVFTLIESIRRDATEKLGIELIPEVERINWDEEA